jgi:hypothetical protein
MIHEIGRELDAKLRAKGCPFKVIDREVTKPTAWKNVVVIEDMPDTVGPARSQSLNPKRYFTRYLGGKLTIYAQSTKTGALEFEHKRIAHQVVDLALVALRKIGAERRQPVVIGRSEFVKIADLEKSERPAGVVYELEFTVERAVEDRTWVGAAAPEGALALYSMTGNPDLTFAALRTITRSAGSWLDDGFAVGMTVRVRGSASNNVDGAITEIAPTILTLGATAIVDEGPVSGCTVIAGGIESCTQVVLGDSPPETACGDC